VGFSNCNVSGLHGFLGLDDSLSDSLFGDLFSFEKVVLAHLLGLCNEFMGKSDGLVSLHLLQSEES